MAFFDDPIAAKLHIHPVLLYAILVVIAALLPVCMYYGDYVYKRDVALYKEQKHVHDSTENVRQGFLRDSLYWVWVRSNDTTLRAVVSVERRPTYGEKGYWRNTGRLICNERKDRKDMVCEPETEFVVTGRYLSGFTMDTIWTYGYSDRGEWVEKARTYAREEAERRRVELPYRGHSENFMLESVWIWFIFILSFLAGGYLFMLLLILLFLFIGWVYEKIFGKDEW